MTIFALLGNKGGAGKTTLCVNLAAALAERDSVVVLDADPQHSALQWRAIDADVGSVLVWDAVADVAGVCAEAQRSFRHVLIDCPPAVDSRQTRAVLRLCDRALIPVQPSPLDLWASVRMEDEIADAAGHNPGLSALLVINQLEPRTRLSQLMRRGLAELSLAAAQTAIHRRMAYRSSVLAGRTVFELGSRGAAAAEEIRRLCTEVTER